MRPYINVTSAVSSNSKRVLFNPSYCFLSFVTWLDVELWEDRPINLSDFQTKKTVDNWTDRHQSSSFYVQNVLKRSKCHAWILRSFPRKKRKFFLQKGTKGEQLNTNKCNLFLTLIRLKKLVFKFIDTINSLAINETLILVVIIIVRIYLLNLY